jgi:formylglycine-generating enzyme required for sulfatase activity
MADIFVCYRREDAQWSAGRINDKLVHAFGAHRVFFDTVTIQPGDDFVEVIGAKVGGCRVLLAVIGPRWLDILAGRLKDDDDDSVRIEITEALRRNVRVVPVLIDGASSPPAERLPAEIMALSRRNAVQIRADTFHANVSGLIEYLTEFLDAASAGQDSPAPSTPLKAGTRFKDGDIGPEMIVVPAGDFLMGSRKGEGDDDERPQQKVTIGYAFAAGIAPVTRGEFAAFIKAANHEIESGAYVWDGQSWKRDPSKSWRDPGFKQDDDHPVVCVSWLDAQAYVAWLKERSGKSYRLLSEAEWEYCCRAGSASAYNTGNSITFDRANFDNNHRGTTSVFKFASNGFGLHDMHGNVWEWCEDNWHGDYAGNPPSDGSIWAGGDDESLRVLRGGSWATILRTSAPPTATGTNPTTATTTAVSALPARFAPEPAGSRSRRASKKAFRAVHDEHGRGPRRDGRPIPRRRLPWETHGLRQARPAGLCSIRRQILIAAPHARPRARPPGRR